MVILLIALLLLRTAELWTSPPLRTSPPPPGLLDSHHINTTVCSPQGWEGLMPRGWLLGWLLILAAPATGFLTRPSEAGKQEVGDSESGAQALPQGGNLT